jgi:predicted lipid-binding transport protein (Tim44 family)
MKLLTALLTSLFVAAFSLIPEDADAARRLGGARNQGVQRQVTPPPKAAPAQQQQAGQTANAAPNAAPAAGNRWLGPLAGLAAGLGLGWLLSQGGFGALASALIMALLAGLVIFALLRIFARKQAPQAGRPLQYAGVGRESMNAPVQPNTFGGGTAPVARAPSANVPAGFDVEGFVRQAKLNFMRLQSANDRGDLEALRDFTTDELYQELSADLAARGGQPQQTDISGLDAQLIEVTTEGEQHWASVSFQGMVREADGTAPEAFHEIWHLRKSVRGDSGWMLAGIQQAS